MASDSEHTKALEDVREKASNLMNCHDIPCRCDKDDSYVCAACELETALSNFNGNRRVVRYTRPGGGSEF